MLGSILTIYSAIYPSVSTLSIMSAPKNVPGMSVIVMCQISFVLF